MNKFDINNRVAQSNELILSSWKMDRTTLKLFEMAVSCIDTLYHDGTNKVFMDKEDIFRMFQADDRDKYSRFKDHCRKLQLQIVEVELKNKRIGTIVPITYIEWGSDDSDHHVEMHFNPKIMPYLVELKKHFTTYEIANLISLKSKYSIILYKLAKMNHWKSNSFTVTIEELREITDTVTLYSRFESFERRVLREPIEEINQARTDILLNYTKIKRGSHGRVTSIEFRLRERLSYNDTDFDNPKPINRLQDLAKPL